VELVEHLLGFSQSKPTPAAREAICCASTSAGSARGTAAQQAGGLLALGLLFGAFTRPQMRFTSPADSADSSPNTCGWRRTSFSLMASSASSMRNRPCSDAICA
jgi:hypothetical protein